MIARLIPCPSCSRHIRENEPACPFCQHSSPGKGAAPPPGAPPPGLGRLARVRYVEHARAALGLALSSLAVACGGRTGLLDGPADACTPPPAVDSGSVSVAAYGVGPIGPFQPECTGDVAIVAPRGVCTCPRDAPGYLLCLNENYSRCSCVLPARYVTCQAP